MDDRPPDFAWIINPYTGKIPQDMFFVSEYQCEPWRSAVAVCECQCHLPGKAMLHFVPCCEGQCKTCKRWFERGLKLHETECDWQPEEQRDA
jgi:hypothetical protein